MSSLSMMENTSPTISDTDASLQENCSSDRSKPAKQATCELSSLRDLLDKIDISEEPHFSCTRDEKECIRIVCWDKPQEEIEALIKSIHDRS